MKKDNISKNITWAEAFKSQSAIRLGINNEALVTDAIIENMKHVAENVFEPLRAHFKKPIGISSFYRSSKLNQAIGGSKTSQHVQGEAIDIDADIFGGITNKEIFEYVKKNLDFDQLIFEGVKTNGDAEWIHVSLKRNGKNRRQILKAEFTNKGVVYTNYI